VAVVVISGLLGTPSNLLIKGTLYITEIYPQICLVSGVVSGLIPNHQFGIHIHDFGDTTEGCASMGEHYNPARKTHGNLNFYNSHAGDLGNIMSDKLGNSYVNKLSRGQFSLKDYHPVIGRGIVIHAKQDDLGLGGNPTSLINGNSGNRIACGIIAYANSTNSIVSTGHY